MCAVIIPVLLFKTNDNSAFFWFEFKQQYLNRHGNVKIEKLQIKTAIKHKTVKLPNRCQKKAIFVNRFVLNTGRIPIVKTII